MKNTLYIIAILALLGAASCAVTSCVKEVPYDNPLSLSAERNNLAAAEGSTQVVVYANGPWKAFLPSDCTWARLENAEGSGLGAFVFSFDENQGGARKVTVTVVSAEKSAYIEMVQNSSLGTLNLTFPYSSVTVAAVSGLAQVPFQTNVQEEEISRMQLSAKSAEGGEIDWLNTLTIFPDHLRFNLEANTTGETRSATISVDYTDVYGNTLSRKLTMKQNTSRPSLSFDSTVTGVMFISKAATIKLPFTTNLQLFVPQLLGSAQSSAEWARIEPAYGATQEIVVNVEENMGQSRIARITLVYTDSEGVETPFEYLLVQKAHLESIDFGQLKAMIPGESGSVVISREALLEAVAISNCDNANIETNPNISTSKIDYTMNWRTAYVTDESLTSGIRMVFDQKEDNNLMRGDRLYIDIAGLTLTKESNPTRYTLSGVRSQHISKAEGKAEVVAREKTLAELSDEDLYTLVKLKGLEFTFKSGAYTNSHDGYQRQLKSPYLNPLGNAINQHGATDYFFSDCTPCSLRDATGRDINALINNETPWRRYGNGVPQGTCDITGIITHTDLLRWAYKGYLGRYQMRILEESDIESVGEAFSKTVVAWNWGPNNTLLTKEQVTRPTSPENPAFYSISSNLETLSTFKFNGNSLPDYNNKINYNKDDTDNSKGWVKGGSVSWTKSSGIFWASDDPSDMSAAPWICFGFSTAGLSGTNLVFNWTASQGSSRGSANNIYAPVLWKVEYSTDGTSFTATDGIWAIHPQVWYLAECSLYAINGNHMYTTPLPASLLGQDRVYVRIRAAAAKAMTSDFTSEDGGELRASDNMVRLGEVAIEYN